MKNLIKQIILEKVTKTKVICDNCGWSWKIKDGGKDPYTCHKCGHDNTPKNKLKEEKLPENREGGEVFPYKGDEYLIQKEKEGQISAFSIINNENVPLETIPNQNLKSFQNPLAVSKDVVKNADITKPIIIGDTGDAYFVLDGNHRLTKAMMKGKDIQAYVLSPEQTEKIKLKYGRPKKKLNENLQSNVIFLPYSDDYNEELEDYNIDEYDVEQQTLDIAKENNLNILRDKNLKGFLFDTTNNKIVGALWTSDDNNSFSFDIAIDKQYQGLKLSHLLIKNAIEEYQIQSDYGNFNLPMEVDVINPMLANILKTKYNFRVVKRITNDRVIMALKKNLKELFDYENKPNKYLGDVINHHRDDSDNEIITIENDGYGMRLVITNHGGLSIKFDYKGISKLTNKNEQYKVANFIIENLKKYINEKNITSITFSINDSNNKRFPIYEYALNKLNFFLERKIENNYFFKKNLNEQKDILNEKCWKGYTQKGMKTMFGKQYPNCVKKLKEDEDYRTQHKTPSKDYGATMDNLTKLYPNDIYSNKALQYYGEGYPYDRLAITIMQSAKDNPNKKIKIYRAVPKDVNTINNGDWVTITKQYAQSHGKSVMNNDYKVISKIVNASTLYTDGNSIHEFGYRI
jgi:hypothetical protein